MRHMKLPLRRESFYDDALPHLPAVEYPFLSGLSYSLLSPVHGWLSQSPSVSAVWDSSLVNRAHWRCGACASIATFMAHQSCLSLLRSLSLSLFLSPLLRYRPLTFIDFNGPGFAQWLPRLAGHGQPGKEPQPDQLIKCPQRLWLNNSLCLLPTHYSSRAPQRGAEMRRRSRCPRLTWRLSCGAGIIKSSTAHK